MKCALISSAILKITSGLDNSWNTQKSLAYYSTSLKITALKLT